jgi:hypothetical protein
MEKQSLTRTISCQKLIECSEEIPFYLGCRPAGLFQGVDQLVPDCHGYLLISPATSIVLANIKPDQATTIYIIPTNISIVWGTIVGLFSLGHFFSYFYDTTLDFCKMVIPDSRGGN